VGFNEGFQFRRQFTGWGCTARDWSYFVRFSDEDYSEVLRTRDISVVYCAYSTNGIGVFRTVGAGHRSRWLVVARQ